jgi:hypothetical protein
MLYSIIIQPFIRFLLTTSTEDHKDTERTQAVPGVADSSGHSRSKAVGVKA